MPWPIVEPTATEPAVAAICASIPGPLEACVCAGAAGAEVFAGGAGAGGACWAGKAAVEAPREGALAGAGAEREVVGREERDWRGIVVELKLTTEKREAERRE
jgi:hypothetical protein